jgi:hypothetical protein
MVNQNWLFYATRSHSANWYWQYTYRWRGPSLTLVSLLVSTDMPSNPQGGAYAPACQWQKA